MYYTSTRNTSLRKNLSEALRSGLAEDGGLFVPEYFPKLDLTKLSPDLSFPQFAESLLQEYFSKDPLQESLTALCKQALNFPVPLKQLTNNTFMLELFHGPTLSFKDFGARFLAESLAKLSHSTTTTIMVATSGDTGSAVASAFYLKPKLQVVILYPKGKISDRQEQQIACWDNNIKALAVHGSFDDCQQLVKTAFQNAEWQEEFHLSSANSINIGRLLPQMTYYAYTSLQFYRRFQQAPGFIVPTGNLGNATAGYWAQQMGFPIREIVLATNANRVIPDYLESGYYRPRKSIETLANAMDVGDPSNFERLQYLFNTEAAFRENVKAFSADDKAIRDTIKDVYQQYKTIICPHTATGFSARKKLSELPWIVVATADPSKFETIIEPIIGAAVPIPVELQKLLDRPVHLVEINANLEEIQKQLKNFLP